MEEVGVWIGSHRWGLIALWAAPSAAILFADYRIKAVRWKPVISILWWVFFLYQTLLTVGFYYFDMFASRDLGALTYLPPAMLFGALVIVVGHRLKQGRTKKQNEPQSNG